MAAPRPSANACCAAPAAPRRGMTPACAPSGFAHGPSNGDGFRGKRTRGASCPCCGKTKNRSLSLTRPGTIRLRWRLAGRRSPFPSPHYPAPLACPPCLAPDGLGWFARLPPLNKRGRIARIRFGALEGPEGGSPRSGKGFAEAAGEVGRELCLRLLLRGFSELQPGPVGWHASGEQRDLVERPVGVVPPDAR